MRKQDFGLIINISSIGGLIGLPYQSLYSASKFAIEGLTESLYKELHSLKIYITMVEPDEFKTGFTEKREISKDTNQSDVFQNTLKIIENDKNSG